MIINHRLRKIVKVIHFIANVMWISCVIALIFLGIISFSSCATHRTAKTTSTANMVDTTHITIYHDSVRVFYRDTTIINYRDSNIIHTKIIERFDPATGNITNRETDMYESLYHEYVDRSSRQIDSLQNIINANAEIGKSDYVSNDSNTDTKKGSYDVFIILAVLSLTLIAMFAMSKK